MGEKISWENSSLNLLDLHEACQDNEGFQVLMNGLEEAAVTEAESMIEEGKITFGEEILTIEQFENESPEFRGALIYHLGQNAIADKELKMDENFALFTLSEDVNQIASCAMLFIIDKLGDFNRAMKTLQDNMSVSVIAPANSKTVFDKKSFMKTKMLCSMVYPWVTFETIVS